MFELDWAHVLRPNVVYVMPALLAHLQPPC
jgi:hypothetical protein